jgi:hypothetical protein
MIVLKSMISIEIPDSLSAIVAAILTCLSYVPYAMIVKSLPSLITSAFPSGISYSSIGTSSSAILYNIFGSKKITGSFDLIAESNKPFA